VHDHSNEPNLRVIGVLSALEKPALLAVALVTGGVLLLWLTPSLAEHAPVIWSAMTPTTAVALLLLAGSLALSAPRSSSTARAASVILALIAMAAGAGVLINYAVGLWHPELPWLRLPAPQTAAGFVLAGAAAALVRRTHGQWRLVADLCAVAFAGLVLFLIAGYVFFVAAFVGMDPSNFTSPHAVFCFALLCFVILARRAQEGSLIAVLVGRGIGSQITRIVLPAIIVLPFAVFALIDYLDRHGILSATYSRAIAAPLEVLAVLAVVAWMGKYTNKLERELRRQSLTDELTGVFNRRGFYAVAEYALHNALRSKSALLLFYFDIDGLKQINDRHGHEVGSMVIRRFAELLADTFRKSDVVARVGGDEFVVLATGAAETASEMLARLQQRVLADNEAAPLPAAVHYSAGHSELRADANIDGLIAEADTIMYEHKRSKRKAA
jgi:diguanylate cyclase (GGDEF)-like protein